MGNLRITRQGPAYYDWDAGNAMLGWRDGKPFVDGNVTPAHVRSEIADSIAHREQAILWLRTWLTAYDKETS